MLIYNITIKIEWSLHEQWLPWMHNEYIAAIMKSDCFTKYQLVRLLEVDEEEGPTYALQLYTVSKADYNRYVELFSRGIEQSSAARWNGGVLSFGTLMEVIR